MRNDRSEERIPNDGYKNSGSRTRCPYCMRGRVVIREKRTIHSDDADFRKDYSRRRRQCINCKALWSTVEIHASVWKLIRQVIDMAADKIEHEKGQNEVQKQE